MTPKEKAKQLIDFFDTIQIDHNKNIGYMFDDWTIEQRKQCTLIAVEGIISVLPSVNGRPSNYQDINKYVREYWKEVKTEINNL